MRVLLQCLYDLTEQRRLFPVFLTLCIAACIFVKLNMSYCTCPDDMKKTSLKGFTDGLVENLLEKSMTKTLTHNDKIMKYIVYDCSKFRGGACGGWSDRMSGILSAFTISLLTKRRFLINFDNPCPLKEYLIPASFNWIYKSSLLLSRTYAYHYFMDHGSDQVKVYMTGSKEINTYFSHDVNFIRMNWDFTEYFRKRPHVGSELPWITKLHYADIYRQLFQLLFKPSSVLQSTLNNQYQTQRSRPKIACAHIRIGQNPNMPDDFKRAELPMDVLWKYFDGLDKEEYDFFVASDSDNVKDFAKKRYPKNVIATLGKITHIDRPYKNDPREGFLKQILDFYTLVTCDILIITDSGFGMLAAYVRDIDSDLYCFRGQDLRPCSRYTIHNTLPNNILAPGSL